MITYRKQTFGRITDVYLDGKRVGVIQPDHKTGMYFYKPLRGKVHGAKMPTIDDVKRSLEN